MILGREAEQSDYLYNFLSGRGAPSAIRLTGHGEMQLYYPKQKELYIASASQVGERMEWVVNGPYAIPRADFKGLGRLAAEAGGEPLFIIEGRPHRFGMVRADARPQVLAPTIAVVKPTPPPQPTERPKVVKRVTTPPKTEAPAATPTPKPFTPLTFDQQAIAMSQGFAERASNGDVIHTAEMIDTLASIAAWYTGDAQNEEAIAKVNGLSKGAAIPLGTRVTIPVGIVKNFKRKQ